ncbi:MAG TPA: response regulator transcription factor [Actinomycetales bacterium]|nr:response regulator transcription factor [Actinomycetales bacterium]
MTTGLRVLVVDDSAPFAEALEEMLATAPGVQVVGAVGHAQDVLPAVRRTQPDVVLMDLGLPGGGGVDATRRLAEAVPHVAVLVLTMQDDASMVRSALDAGAAGYLVKGAGRDEILRALDAVARGDVILSGAAARHARRVLGSAGQPVSLPPLTPRELAVLDRLAAGGSTESIARSLEMAPKTVRNHVAALVAKLGVADRAAAVARARDAGLPASR